MMHMKTSELNSQMKGESVVVAITDNTNKPFREHDFKKGKSPGGPNACKVYIPFNSEYKILIKNQNNARIKINAELDGTDITSTGLVLNALDSIYLERFVTGEGKKFLFVPVDNDAVGDPTAKENGILRIKIAKEKPIDIDNKTIIHNHHYYNYNRSIWDDFNKGIWNREPTVWGGPYDYSAADNNVLYGSNTNMSASFSASSISDLHSKGESSIGATIEGAKSDQVFSSTAWNGDNGTSYTFVFKLLGVSSELTEAEKKEYEEFKRLQAKFGDI